MLLLGALLVWMTPRWPLRTRRCSLLVLRGARVLVARSPRFARSALLFDAATPALGLCCCSACCSC